MLLKALAWCLAVPLVGTAGEPPRVDRVDLGGGVSLDFVRVPAGSVPLGSDENTGGGDEGPIHRVRFTRPVAVARCETTQAQWTRVMGFNPSRFRGTELPVDSVSWTQARAFAAKVGALAHRRVRLPSEAEWEYAARAGTDTIWSFGSDVAQLSRYAWFDGNAGGITHPVGALRPNPWGLCDMYGNVGEWCEDGYVKHAYPDHAVTDPAIIPVNRERPPVWRGGAWGDNAEGVRSSARNCSGPDDHGPGLGVRLWMEEP